MTTATVHCTVFRTFTSFIAVCLTVTLLCSMPLSLGVASDQYVGCFREGINDTNLVMYRPLASEEELHKMTLEWCRTKCQAHLKTYFGLTAKYYCSCGDSGFDKFGAVDNSLCNSTCPGNNSQICGGWIDPNSSYISVYSVCPFGYYGRESCNTKCGHCRVVKRHSNRCQYSTGVCLARPQCAAGWEGQMCKNDTDECRAEDKGNCTHDCVNTEGSFYCSCHTGYKLNSDNRTCDDINECATGTHDCSQECINTPGSFNCSCNYKTSHNTTGYILKKDGRTCEDIDECQQGNRGGCAHNCSNTIGDYNCSCNSGYKLNDDRENCSDIDECQLGISNCNQYCTNTQGSYNCSCNWTSYTLNKDGRTCEDIDECKREDNGGCAHNCTNTDGSYYCNCTSGYKLNDDRRNCSDIDECSRDRGGCDHNCYNTIGSFYCTCKVGFALQPDHKTCINVIECNTNNGNCSDKCYDTEGSYHCSCRKGYELGADQHICKDIDECSVNNGDCDHHCFNTDSAYECYCSAHYLQVGKTCQTTAMVIIIPLISTIFGLLVMAGIIAGFFCLLKRRRRRTPEQHIMQTTVNHCQHFASTENGNHQSMDEENDHRTPVHNVIPETVDEYAVVESTMNEGLESNDIYGIYASIALDPDSSPTRVSVATLPIIAERIKKSPEKLRTEFRDIPQQSESAFDFAQQLELKPKNRFKNILPSTALKRGDPKIMKTLKKSSQKTQSALTNNENRVKLPRLDDDPLTTYINASFIEGYTEDEKIIASHGPTMNTIDDFWRMIWEYNVGVIVMVTKCQEEAKVKCEQYWPERTDSDKYGRITVCRRDTHYRVDHVIRMFAVSQDDEPQRMLTHFQFVDWPDHGVPEHAVGLLNIRHVAKRLLRNDQYLVVHCSAGVGRTGGFLAIDYLLQQASTEKAVDVNQCVRKLRKGRMNSVQTLQQYQFIFKAVLEGTILGETTKSIHDFNRHIEELRTLDEITNVSIIEKEFKMLEAMHELPDSEKCSDATSEENRSKNRDMNLLPTDGSRVCLQNVVAGRTDYINAVFVPGFFQKKAFIATQLPTDETCIDFWTMCLDYKCRTIVYLGTEELGFLPNSEDGLFLDSLVIGDLRQVAEQETEHLEHCDVWMVNVQRGDATRADDAVYANTFNANNSIRISNGNDCCQLTIIRVLLPTDAPTDRDTLIEAQQFLSRIAETTHESEPIIVMSSDGVNHCGQFIAICNIADMIASQNEVDVFQIVYYMKGAQPHFFTNLDDYDDIYLAAEVYVSQH